MAKSKAISKELINAILYIVVGALFCILQSRVLNWLLTAVGVLFIVQGVLSILKKDLKSGIISIAIGALLILGAWLFITVVLIIFGALLIVKGVLDLLTALKNKDNIMPIVVAALTIVLGILVICSNWLDWFFIVVGVLFIANGVLALFGKKLI